MIDAHRAPVILLMGLSLITTLRRFSSPPFASYLRQRCELVDLLVTHICEWCRSLINYSSSRRHRHVLIWFVRLGVTPAILRPAQEPSGVFASRLLYTT